MSEPTYPTGATDTDAHTALTEANFGADWLRELTWDGEDPETVRTVALATRRAGPGQHRQRRQRRLGSQRARPRGRRMNTVQVTLTFPDQDPRVLLMAVLAALSRDDFAPRLTAIEATRWEDS